MFNKFNLTNWELIKINLKKPYVNKKNTNEKILTNCELT